MEEAGLMGSSGGFEQGKPIQHSLGSARAFNSYQQWRQINSPAMSSPERVFVYLMNSAGQAMRLLRAAVLVGCVLVYGFGTFARAADPQVFSLQQTIGSALDVNLNLKASREETGAFRAETKVSRARLLPTFGASYQYVRNDQELFSPGVGVTRPKNEYTFSTSITQPVFRGFALINQAQIAALGTDAAKFNEEVLRQDIILEAKNSYFSLLRAQKLQLVAEETIKQISQQKDVAQNFHEVGLTPLNDLLQAQVELANARLSLVVAQNNVEAARADFNTLLRRPINAPVTLEDITRYSPLLVNLQQSLAEARRNRTEFKIAQIEIEIAAKEVAVARAEFFPSVDVQWQYVQQGEDWDASGGGGDFGDSSSWDIAAIANWNFWEWGRTYHNVSAQRKRLTQAHLRRQELQDSIDLQVKRAYLKVIESQQNITTAQKAVIQAEENIRITQESYKEQVSTATDVTVAQTLLSQSQTNYFNSLYDFKIAKAALYRAMNREVWE